ncbi:MAG: DNA-binding response regulator [Anaerolineaceae bacterium]|nr:DNA-binding response regulator [Anaerolineaceae bacterium]
MYKILVIDDDIQMLELIGQLLEREGYDVQVAEAADEALGAIERQAPDLFLIDLMLPGTDGLALCRQIRRNPKVKDRPILFITGHDTDYDVTDALAAGGDDYILKPFAVRELTARLRAHLRRITASEADTMMPHLQVYARSRTVLVDGREVDLTQVECDLLRYLCQTPTKLHSTADLLTNVWQYPPDAGDAALVRNHIRNLRRKLELSPERPEIIQSRHGRGYTVRANIEFVDEPLPRYL